MSPCARTASSTLRSLFRIGIVWAGNPGHAEDRRRSVPFEHFLDLLDIPKIALLSLQKGPRARDLEASGVSALFSNLDKRLTSLADTAAVIEQLDLVITCDTSIAHLAGAMGKPVWVLLAFSADWRWLTDRPAPPWYPSACLFRQPRPGDWTSAMKDVVAALKEVR